VATARFCRTTWASAKAARSEKAESDLDNARGSNALRVIPFARSTRVADRNEDQKPWKLRLTSGAEALLAACKQHGVKLLLVSGGFTFFTERLKSRLGIDYTIANILEIRDGLLTGRVSGSIVEAEAKAAKFRSIMKELNALKIQTAAIGDGANDLKMMAEAGISIAFHAKPVVRAQASCALSWCGLDAVPNLFE
jgi:phosphoserine phosphatase